MFIAFAICFAVALALQADVKNVGLIGTIYFGVMQVTLFAHGVVKGEKKLVRKLVGALIVSSGLVYLATTR